MDYTFSEQAPRPLRHVPALLEVLRTVHLEAHGVRPIDWGTQGTSQNLNMARRESTTESNWVHQFLASLSSHTASAATTMPAVVHPTTGLVDRTLMRPPCSVRPTNSSPSSLSLINMMVRELLVQPSPEASVQDPSSIALKEQILQLQRRMSQEATFLSSRLQQRDSLAASSSNSDTNTEMRAPAPARPAIPLAASAQEFNEGPSSSKNLKNDASKALEVLGRSLKATSDPYIDVASLETEEITPRRTRGGVAEPFPDKLYRMLEESEKNGLSDVVSFYSHGRAFGVHNMERFMSEVMPKYFKQKRWASFSRQLNLYGFQRINAGPDVGGYYHELFLKGRPDFLVHMRRVGVPNGDDRRKLRGRKLNKDPDFYSMKPVVPS